MDFTAAQAAFDARLKRGWTPIDVRGENVWFSPSAQKLSPHPLDKFNGTLAEFLAAHPDAVQITESGCPKCLVGYADIMSDPMFVCDLCFDTGFPVFTPK